MQMNISTLSPEKKALLERRLGVTPQKRTAGRVIPKRPNRNPAPLSFLQRQIWVIDQMAPGNPAYNLPYGYRLRGSLDLKALENSFNEIIRRHETLRTTFVVEDGEPLQIIHEELKIRIQVTALDHLPADQRESTVQALASELSVQPFDLSHLPLVRVFLFTLAETEHVLIFNLHHIIADGLSTELLVKELDTFYRTFTEGTEALAPELTIQYGDFALWQQQSLGNESAYANELEFWRKQLGGELPVLELPTQRARPALQSFNGSNVFFEIPAELASELKALGSQQGCTFFMTVLAAYRVLLQRYSGANDIIIGTPVAGRGQSELTPLIGLILNMVALRCDVSDDPTFTEALRRNRDATLDAFSNDLPLELLIKHLKFQRDPSRNPIFQAVLQVLPQTAPKLGNVEVSSFYFDLRFAQFDLALHLYEEGDEYKGRFQYCTDLFDRGTIERLSESFLQLLNEIVRNPHQKISAVPLLSVADRQLLNAWNQTAAAYPPARCVHEMVEAQARIRPNALAVEMAGRQLSYRELDERAEILAGRLRKHGVQADSVVAIYLERSLEMIVSLLAVWKAGGAYVPVDPEYPAERIRLMLEDAKAVAVITQGSLSAQY